MTNRTAIALKMEMGTNVIPATNRFVESIRVAGLIVNDADSVEGGVERDILQSLLGEAQSLADKIMEFNRQRIERSEKGNT